MPGTEVNGAAAEATIQLGDKTFAQTEFNTLRAIIFGEVDQGNNAVQDDAQKWEKLYSMIKHKSKIVNFNPSNQSNKENIRDFLEKFWGDVSGSARNLCQWDLDKKPLTDLQYSELLKLKLDYSVQKEVYQKFESCNPKLTRATVTRDRLDEILYELYGNKKPQISNVLEIFGSNRLKKSSETSVISFNCQWREQLPLCLNPKTSADKDKFIDLIQRSAYYHALDDPFIQKELSNIPESSQSLVKFQEEAIKAEARRNHFKETAEKSGSVDSSDISVNRSEYVHVPGRSRGRGGGGNRRPRRGGRGGAAAPRVGGGGGYAQAPHAATAATPGHVTPGGQHPRPSGASTMPTAPRYYQQPAPRGGAARGRGYPRQQFVPVCYICDVIGHISTNCPNRYRKQTYENNGAPGNSKLSVEDIYEEEDLEQAGVNQVNCDEDEVSDF